METTKQNIVDLFYLNHLKVKEIAEKLNVSSAYVTKVIKQEERYLDEKEFRKNNSKDKRKIAQNTFIKEKREKQRREDNYAFVQEQHRQASKELSKPRHLTNETYRKWNSSVYNYNPSKRRYEFDSNIVRPYAIPKYIKVR